MILLAFCFFVLICIFGVVANSAVITKPTEQLMFRCIAIALICFVGFRQVGIDQDSRAYELFYSFDLPTLWLTAEPTFVLIVEALRHFLSRTDGLVYLFLIYATLGIIVKFTAIKKLTDLTWLTVVVYFSTYFLLHEFTQIRAAIASGLILLAVIPIAERRLSRFLALITTAVFFHYSALVAYPLYFLSNRQLTKGTKYVLGLSLPVGVAFHFLNINPILAIPIETVQLKLEVYALSESMRGLKLNVFNALYLIRYAVFYVLVYFSSLLQERSRYFPVLLKIYAMSLFAYLALSTNSTVAMRISELLGIVEIILIPLLYYTTKPRRIAVILIFIFAAVSLCINIFWTELIYQTVQPAF